jgi:hypothetical protein
VKKHVLALAVAASLAAGFAPAQVPPLPPPPVQPAQPPLPPLAMAVEAPPLPPLPPEPEPVEVVFFDDFDGMQGQTSYPQDPADSLYRAARTALNKGDFKGAAQLFHQIPVSYSRSAYAADALYWEAFALYRVGGAARCAPPSRGWRSRRAATRGPPRAATRTRSRPASAASWPGRGTRAQRTASRGRPSRPPPPLHPGRRDPRERRAPRGAPPRRTTCARPPSTD